MICKNCGQNLDIYESTKCYCDGNTLPYYIVRSGDRYTDITAKTCFEENGKNVIKIERFYLCEYCYKKVFA